MTPDEWALIYFVFSSLAMICVAILGYSVAQLFAEIHASKKPSATTVVRSRSRPGPVWEVNQDGDECEEAP
jgi:hypothetical protein